MSTGVLYHCFGITGRGIHHVHTRYEAGRTIFRIGQDPTTLLCSACGSRRVWKKGTLFRRFITLPIGLRVTIIEFPIQRVLCLVCGVTRQVKIGFAEPDRRYTKRFGRYVLDLSKHMTMTDVAHHLGISWHTVKEIQKTYLCKHFSRPSLKGLKRIAVDEISIGHGHHYLTVVLDLDSGAVVFVGEGKGADAMGPFWRRLKSSRARIEAVAMDMSQAYISTVRSNLPYATIVFDHFHVIKLMNEKLTELRRDLYREATDLLHKNVLKGSRWLLLKNPENLQDDRNERARLEEALSLNKPLATAYYMKEDLRLLWSLPDKATADAHLQNWIARAQASGIRILKDLAKTLSSHKRGILAYYDHRISTGPLEATNNKIKTLQRQAYGFRDRTFFILRIYALHTTRYELVG
ncbi:MAG TPA: ISL3 family transposase [Desulfomonilaceae bacterium]|nr:ISL3 family transposase [Desulfomonilaceae bacterium]